MEQKGRLKQLHEAGGYNCSSKWATTKDRQQANLALSSAKFPLIPGSWLSLETRGQKDQTSLTAVSPHPP